MANWFWKLLFFKSGPYQPDPKRTPKWNRGAYVVTALAHCGECHTPRNQLGALDVEMELAGTLQGPEDTTIPNITPDAATGIGDWTRSELVDYLGLGEVPDGPYADGLMAEVIEDGLQYLSADDIDAIAEYVWTLPGRRNEAVAESR
jgi:mono/diheme cytochrome c family protein